MSRMICHCNALIFLVAVLAFSGCGGDGTPSNPDSGQPDPTEVKLTLSPANARLRPSDTIEIKLELSPVKGKNPVDLYVFYEEEGRRGFFSEAGDDLFEPTPRPLARAVAPDRPSTLVVYAGAASALPAGRPVGYQALAMLAGAAFDPARAACAPAVAHLTVVADAANPADAAQVTHIGTLKEKSASPLRLELAQGALWHMEGDLAAVDIAPGANPQDADAVAMAFLERYSELLRVPAAHRAMRMIGRRQKLSDVLMFRQTIDEIPVYGSALQLVLRSGAGGKRLWQVNGRYLPDPGRYSLTGDLGPEEIRAAVARRLNIQPSALRLIAPLRQWVVDPALFAPACPSCPSVPHAPRLAWRVLYLEPGSGGAADEFWDAARGELILERARAFERDYRIYDANGEGPESCFIGNVHCDAEYDEGGVCRYEVGCPAFSDCCSNLCAWGHWRCASPDTEEQAAFEYTNDIYNFLHDVFGRDSYDGHDGILRMYLHAGSSWVNAMSRDCGAYQVHIFGDDVASLNVMAHEVGHSYHGSEADYDYQDEPGAVAEHIADAIGHFVGFWTGKDPNWIIGDGSAVGNRDMSNPPADEYATGDPYPDHYRDYLNTRGASAPSRSNDRGGVHRNHMILSKALYLFTDGGSFEGFDIRGIGEEKARRLYQRAIDNYLADNANFSWFVRAVNSACQGSVGRDGFSANDCCQVQNAFAAVGIGDPDRDCDGTLDAADTDDDGDGVRDLRDNCPQAVNPDQANADGDGHGDLCDIDADNDGLPNEADNCALVENPGQTDRNADGQGDACDDSDGDGVMDDSDNCPTTRNRDQANLDRDSEGNACDDDDDNDGLADREDNCPLFYNAAQDDSDGDGHGDPCDNCSTTANHDQADLDEDHRGDACDDDMDDDGVANEDDNCPREAHEEMEFALCPPNTSCRYGCPSTPLLPGFGLRLQAEALLGADPTVLQPLARFSLEPCNVLDCGDGRLLAPGAGMSVALTMQLAAAQVPPMEQPMVVHAVIFDQSGRALGKRDALFYTNQGGKPEQKQLQLGFAPAPSYAWGREAGAGHPARPAYQMALSIEVGSQQNAELLRDYGLIVQSSVTAATIP